jgi:hypothetical protein
MLESLRGMFITGQDDGEEGEGYEDAAEAGGDFEDLEAEGDAAPPPPSKSEPLKTGSARAAALAAKKEGTQTQV